MGVALGGCGSAKEAPAKKDAAGSAVTPRDAVAIDAAVDAPEKKREVFLHGAGRCGECHEKMFDEWERSAHAKAASSPLYQAAAADAKDNMCARCHTPLIDDAPKDAILAEGVTCDVCHTLRDPKPAPTGAGFRLAVDDMVKFGPRCNLDDHYFHRMGCSPEHKTSEICGACHYWERKGVPVFTEYAEWKETALGKAGEPCQACHMPPGKAALAVGAAVREGVPDHGLLGVAMDLRKTALSLEATAQDGESELEVAITLTNVGAGHAVPTGLPERRIVVTTRIKDAAGKEVGVQATALGRILVDASGAEVPFWRAVKVQEDTRVQAGASRTVTARFPPPDGAGTIEIEVEHRLASDAMAKALGLADVEHRTLITTKLAFGAFQSGKHKGLPRSVAVKAAKAGTKRAPKQGRP